MRLHSKLIFLVVFVFTVSSVFAQANLENLGNRVKNGSNEDKRNALFEIRNLHDPAVSRYAVPALTATNELVRATAPSAVRFLPSSEAASLISPLLNDKAPFVRREAALALGETGDSSAVEPLIKTLKNDREIPVRSDAAVALGMIGDPAAVEALTAVLKKNPSESEEYLRRSSARAIGQIAQFIRTGNRRVDTPKNFLPEKYKDPKPPKAAVTATFPAFRTAAETLRTILSNAKEADDTRREAAFALGAIGDSSARSVLTNSLTAADNYLAEICKEALIKLDQ